MLQYTWSPNDRIEMLHHLPKGGVVAEIGVHTGKFAEQILNIVKPTTFYLVDLWPDCDIMNGLETITGPEALKLVNKNFKSEIDKDIVKIVHCDSRELHTHVAQHTFDWIYLDTFHRYPTTLYELYSIAPLLKPNGLILGHDYNMVTEQGFCSVKRSVDEFMINSDYRLVMLTKDKFQSYGLMKF